MSRVSAVGMSRHVHLSALNQPSKSALIVDDSPVNRKIAEIHLRALGFDVDMASDGSEAITKCKRRKFDLIIMDVAMPGISGIECVQFLRKYVIAAKDSVILGWSTFATADECLQAGMNGTLPKPLDPQCLRVCLQSITGRFVGFHTPWRGALQS